MINNTTYSETINGWLYEPSGVVYNNDTYYPIGKICKDENGNFKKLDKDVYILEQIINIPIFKLYSS